MSSSIKASSTEDAAHDYSWDAIQSALKRYLRGRGTRPDVVDDVTQETLARLIELARKEQIGSIVSLAFRIADNLVIDIYRRESRLQAEIDDDIRSDEPSLNRVLDSRRAMEVFNLCLRKMPKLRREVLIRRRVNQESCRAIGDDLAMSAKAVEKHITRGMIDLRRALDHARIDLAGQD